MIFSSIVFIFFFLPIVLVVFHSLRKNLRFPFLLLSSLFFYFFGENYLIWIMLTTIVVDYFSGLLIAGGLNQKPIVQLIPNGHRSNLHKFWLTVSIISNLSLLGFFKYFNFFTDNIIQVLDLLHLSHLKLDGLVKISLPLGISFYTFQSMSYTIDVYRGHVAANRNFIKFATFVTMFPQLVAGPIVRYSEIDKQLNNHTIKFDQFVEGIQRFIIGLAKKVLIANTLGKIADQIFLINSNELPTIIAWIGILAYSLQIYFDFSGYSCMAIGLGKMFGFEFSENFNYPYISTSIKEFWRRWHISLSTWFRDYLYIPLGGSKGSGIKTYLNLFIVFSLCGLWHGASWNFLIWGLFHGFFLSMERIGVEKWLHNLPKLFRHFYVLFFVSISWVFFRAETLSGSIEYLKSMFFYRTSDVLHISEFLQPNVLIAFALGILFSTPLIPKFLTISKLLRPGLLYLSEITYFSALFTLLLLSIMYLTSGSFNPFIYFRF